MTRKRFIKLLCGRYGVKRNNANAIAETTRERGGAYAHALAYFQFVYAEIIRRTQKAMEDLLLYGEAFVPVIDLCSDIQPYYGKMDFEIKPVQDPPPLKFMYPIDTAVLCPSPLVQWTKENTYIKPAAEVAGHE